MVRLKDLLGGYALLQKIVRLVQLLVRRFLQPAAAPAGHGRDAREHQAGPWQLPIQVEVLPVPSAEPAKGQRQPDAIRLRSLLARIRLARESRSGPGQVEGLELELRSVMALLQRENAPAHELSGMTQLVEQLRRIQGPACCPGAFETGMFWMLLEREVQSMVKRHG